MSARQDNLAFARSADAIPNNEPTTASNPRENGRDPLSSEDIDAHIRWFFEHAVQRARLSR